MEQADIKAIFDSLRELWEREELNGAVTEDDGRGAFVIVSETIPSIVNDVVEMSVAFGKSEGASSVLGLCFSEYTFSCHYWCDGIGGVHYIAVCHAECEAEKYAIKADGDCVLLKDVLWQLKLTDYDYGAVGDWLLRSLQKKYGKEKGGE